MNSSNLQTYLNDHHAGSVIGLNKARSIRDHAQPGSALALFLDRFIGELQEERSQLRAMIATLGFSPSTVKLLGGWLTHKVSEVVVAKLGVVYRPFSRFLDLETLVLGVTGKLSMWKVLKEVQASEPRLAPFDFIRLENMALGQRAALDRFRIEAGLEAFGPVEQPSEKPVHAATH